MNYIEQNTIIDSLVNIRDMISCGEDDELEQYRESIIRRLGSLSYSWSTCVSPAAPIALFNDIKRHVEQFVELALGEGFRRYAIYDIGEHWEQLQPREFECVVATKEIDFLNAALAPIDRALDLFENAPNVTPVYEFVAYRSNARDSFWRGDGGRVWNRLEFAFYGAETTAVMRFNKDRALAVYRELSACNGFAQADDALKPIRSYIRYSDGSRERFTGV